jgi:ATP-binding cassette subfamily G (WHITE) protein 2 (SNQ2)
LVDLADVIILNQFRYEPANRQTTADFLVAVTDPAGRIPGHAAPRPPQTSTEFAEHFKKSELGSLNQQEIEDYVAKFVGKPERANAYRESARQDIAKGASKRR